MEIQLKINEPIKIIYDKCPRCHKAFNQKKHKKTENHAIPKFLKPETEITHSLCLSCHQELNDYYKIQDIQAKKYRVKSKDFQEFLDNYGRLKNDFYNKKIHRGQFGEGLWSNVTTLLESFNQRLEELEVKGGKKNGKTKK